MKILRYKEIAFDDYTDQRGWYNDGAGDYWVSICPECLEKYKTVLGNHVTEDGASGYCCVCGCGEAENAEYYVDFSAGEVEEIDVEEEN